MWEQHRDGDQPINPTALETNLVRRRFRAGLQHRRRPDRLSAALPQVTEGQTGDDRAAPNVRPFRAAGPVRSASSEPAAADAVREMIGGQLTAFAALMDGDRPDVRASLLATQLLGVVFARFIVRLEPLASMDGKEIADWLAPTFDLYLTRPLDDSPD